MSRSFAEFEYEGVRLVGTTAAGEETCIVAPEFNVGFDVGRAPRELLSVDHVFLSHGHIDHAAGVGYYCAQRKFIDLPPGNVYAAPALVEPLRDLLRIWGEIDGAVPPGRIHPAAPDTDVEIRRNLLVRPFEVCHSGRGRGRQRYDALGFALIEVRRKLKAEYLELTGPQIVELKQRGVEITDRIEVPLVAYCGDTAPGPFLERDDVRRARVLLLECTFLDPDHGDRARAGNHMHLVDVARILPSLENERILLVHLTRRTLMQDARRMLRAALGDAYGERVTMFMEHRRPRRRADAPRPGSADA